MGAVQDFDCKLSRVLFKVS